jgi:SatD family (SatD)
MIAIITGDLIKSNKVPAKVWTNKLKDVLSSFGNSPKTWIIYRGDEFQVEISNPEDALSAAILIKSAVKSIGKIDVRMSIGLGVKNLNASKIIESNGSAFVNSGRSFEHLKKSGITLACTCDDEAINVDMNFVLSMATEGFMDKWSQASSEIVYLMLTHQNLNQTEMALKLDMAQSAISKRLNRAKYDLVLELIKYYQRTIKKINP